MNVCVISQFAGAILHLPEADPAPDQQLHGDPQVAAGDSAVSQRLPRQEQLQRQRRQ